MAEGLPIWEQPSCKRFTDETMQKLSGSRSFYVPYIFIILRPHKPYEHKILTQTPQYLIPCKKCPQLILIMKN